MARRRAQSPAYSAARRVHATDAGSEEEATKTESQQVLAVGQILKKPKIDDNELQQFRATVTADQKKLKGVLAQRALQAKKEEKRRRDELASMVLEALQSPNRPTQGETPTFAGTTITGNAIYDSATNILTASGGLVQEYQRLDGMIAKMREEQAEPIAETWKQQVEETDKQLKLGARVALRNVKKVLGADVESEEMGMADGDRDVDMDVEGDTPGEGTVLNYELQKSLRYAERGVKRMVKGLPMDENH
ncbi:hypothetical protein EJ02DRAFT_370778 [Clathrospora elynae]|uniref:Uncharacterized protein n=1 Tax=Clathrospora elynae TaxID=706981 RepID=A0A6A5T6T6_9PLEO|nr:hypothetical protein EJ02DRAFT_370778 [Clathrospora elynae]